MTGPRHNGRQYHSFWRNSRNHYERSGTGKIHIQGQNEFMEQLLREIPLWT